VIGHYLTKTPSVLVTRTRLLDPDKIDVWAIGGVTLGEAIMVERGNNIQ
jgi:hypothetical protein